MSNIYAHTKLGGIHLIGHPQNILRIKQKLKKRNHRLNKPTSRDALKKIETEYGITLPDELVMFYTEISNGCTMIDGFELLCIENWKIDSKKIKCEFPFSECWLWEVETEPDKDLLQAIHCGNISLIDIGCGQTWRIVIKGGEKGNMWFFTDVGIQPCSPKQNFLSWLEFWLDGNEDYFS